MAEQPVNKNRTIIIIVAVVAALGCFCLIAGIVGYYAFTTIRSVESSPVQPSITQAGETATPEFDFEITYGDPPSGGLGNDILKNDTWQVIAPAAIGLGCDLPIAADSTIEVLEQPDAAGQRWVEKWTVACLSGDAYAFGVEFIVDATGATYNIKSLP